MVVIGEGAYGSEGETTAYGRDTPPPTPSPQRDGRERRAAQTGKGGDRHGPKAARSGTRHASAEPVRRRLGNLPLDMRVAVHLWWEHVSCPQGPARCLVEPWPAPVVSALTVAHSPRRGQV